MIDVHCNRNWMVTKSDVWGFLKISILKKTIFVNIRYLFILYFTM